MEDVEKLRLIFIRYLKLPQVAKDLQNYPTHLSKVFGL